MSWDRGVQEEAAAFPNLGQPAVGVTSCELQACLALFHSSPPSMPCLTCAAGALPMGLTAEPDAVTVALPPPAPSTPVPAAAVPGGIDSLSTDTEEQDAVAAGSSSSSRDGGGSSSTDSGGSSSGSAQAASARHVLLVACDGLWDYVTNQEAVDIALRCAETVRRTEPLGWQAVLQCPGQPRAAASCTSALPAINYHASNDALHPAFTALSTLLCRQA